ncbi:MAG: hypothetical protein PHY09_14285 [Desulfuromonadaceae bacterium]|nr:hypothetical protein [Desulfuromonadaceae bacterium]MDD5105018.1 hypothetical protein [Desulfuromonadaceae bacterium]
MSISRKEFFRQGFLSLGKTALDLTAALEKKTTLEDGSIQEPTAPPEPRPDMVAEALNARCLARNCGCLACAEKCSGRAIMVIPGTGIRIDRSRCIG